MTSLPQRLDAVWDFLTGAWTPSFLFLMVVATLQHDPRLTSDLSYGLILIFVCGGVFLGLRQNHRLDPDRFSAIPMILTGLWVYGIILGLWNGISPTLVFRNFAAMSLFFVYYVFVLLSPTLKSIQQGLYAGAVAFVAASIYVFLTGETKGAVEAIGFVAIRYHYFLGSLVAGAVMFTLTVRSVITGPFRIAHLIFGMAIFWAIFLSGSRAYYLALFLTMLLLVMCFAASTPRRLLRATSLGLGYALFAIVLLVVSTGVQDGIGAAYQSIAMEVDVMSPRSVQFDALIAEIDLVGSGLGASLKSGYLRDSLGYGFELSYLSLAHKVGILGLLIFVACAGFHIVRCVATMVRSDYSASMILALSLMGFLVSAWGNPMLFAPVFVCMFCISLYIERTVAKELVGGA